MTKLSLDELLDGSYRYSNVCLDKGKKAPHGESILHSVRKACAVLPPHGAKECSSNSKALTCFPRANSCSQNLSDSHDVHKCVEDSEPSSKVWDSSWVNMSNFSLYQPKDILEHLALPPAQHLDALLSELNMPSVLLKSTRHTTALCSGSLPPWSFSYSGACKLIVDLGKLAPTRNICQGRWVRVGSNSNSIWDDKCCFFELDIEMCYYNNDPLYQQKVDDLPDPHLGDKTVSE